MKRFFSRLSRTVKAARQPRPAAPRARIQLEALEGRELLSASPLGLPLVQPAGLVAQPAAAQAVGTLTPAEVRHAYGVDRAWYNVGGRTIQGDGSGQTIAIVDAYHDPYALRDLQTFDRQFGLPDPSFRQYYFGSATNTNDHWSLETDLDVQWAHAIAPRANIILIEAASNSTQDLYTAVNWVRQQAGVSVVSMSFGAPEWSGQTSYDGILSTPAGHNGITFVASAGDNGNQNLFPAMSPHVVAVGGTHLYADASGNYLGETAWAGSGGGYSRVEREPGYQYSAQRTGWRTGPDVAYNADTPVWVSYTAPSTGRQSWQGVRGTSAGAPQWAALVAIADQIRVAAGEHTLDGASQTLYGLYSAAAGDFHDVTSGSNGYAAGWGYDLVTGRGTPYADRVILDLVRVSDGFHGAVAATASASAAAGRPGALVAAQALAGEGGQTAALVALTSESKARPASVERVLSDLATFVGSRKGEEKGPTVAGRHRPGEATAEADFLAAVFDRLAERMA